MDIQLMIDTKKESYGTFFKDDFATRAFDASDDCPALRMAVLNLVAAWRGASYAAALPSLLVTTLTDFHDAYTRVPSSAGMLRYSEVVLAKLCRELPILSSDQNLVRSIQSKLLDISCEISAIDQEKRVELEPETVWQQYLKLHPFVLGVHTAMSQAYLAIFGAYENFMVSLVSIALEGKRVRVNDGQFKKDFRKAFGDQIDVAWYSPDLQAARLVRHSLIHAGWTSPGKVGAWWS